MTEFRVGDLVQCKAWKNVDAMERAIIEMLEKITGEGNE